MALLFSALPELLGRRRGYFAAFCVYWIAFGIGLPVFTAGLGPLLSTLVPRPLPGGVLGIALALLLVGPPAVAAFGMFRPRLPEATPAILAASAGIALVNGFAEELLWRGAFIKVFPADPILAVLLPAIGFGVWHLAPQIVLPVRNRGGVVAFVAWAFVLGLAYGAVAYLTGSIALTIASHVLTDFFGLAGAFYLRSRSGVAPALAD